MRNKSKGFPNRISFSGEPRAKPEYSSQRANGTIKARPQQRMFRSNEERDNPYD